jgi:hypothetical protein
MADSHTSTQHTLLDYPPNTLRHQGREAAVCWSRGSGPPPASGMAISGDSCACVLWTAGWDALPFPAAAWPLRALLTALSLG